MANQPKAPTALFQGCNSVLGHGLDTAVEGGYGTVTAVSELSCTVADSFEDLAEAIRFRQSLSTALAPAAPVSRKAAFLAALKPLPNSLFVVIQARYAAVQKRSMATVPGSPLDLQFKAGITLPRDDAEADQFVRRYGDSFVSEITTGSEYLAVHTFHPLTRKSRDEIAARLKARGIVTGATVDGNLADAFRKLVTQDIAFDYVLHQFLTAPDLTVPENWWHSMEFAIQFPARRAVAAEPISWMCSGYGTVDDTTRGFAKVVENRSRFIGTDLADGLTRQLSQVTKISNQIAWVSDLYDLYCGYDDPILTERAAAAQADIQAIRDQMTAFAVTPTADFPKLTQKSPDNGVPLPDCDVHKGEYWGSRHGTAFSIEDEGDLILRRTRPASIRVHAEDNRVVGLSITYLLGTTLHVHLSIGDTTYDKTASSLSLKQGWSITRVEGRLCDNGIEALEFGAADFSRGRSRHFSWGMPREKFIIGFCGHHSDTQLHGIQVIYGSFKPASWSTGDGNEETALDGNQ